MDNPYAINVHCDGAMDYDSKQTGGNGFIIEFPESINADPIAKSLRNDGQGIHRLEMISILEAIEELLSFAKNNPGVLRKAGGVDIYTDRFHVTDDELLNPYRIQGWRREGWKTYEGKSVKDKDLLDSIDKARKKLSQEIGGRVEIKYKRRKKNKTADKLSKVGKMSVFGGRRILQKKNRNVARRKFDAPEINYELANPGDYFLVRVYAWERVQDEFEVCVEIINGPHTGKVMKIYINGSKKADVHRQHYYEIEVGEVYTHHIRANSFKEVSG
jgi:ribonuclease HI